MPHGAPGVKFYAFEGVDSGKEPIRVQRYLEKRWRKKPPPNCRKTGLFVFFFFLGGMTPKPRSVFFFVRLHCQYFIFCMFLLHSVIQPCINSFLH